ncbi:MAG: FtsW/RodA/SpoVE family cell cycle protein [Firmicutes bacterium HGW-Firmicutes-12]|nr:MAG: FtsW/RodA/SpoVE family cell cycle protein [Firmicutes bacterium HGW-Firmicutes-12]
MQKSIKISKYIQTVCEQIRWRIAHSVISEEIENHIIDQTNAFIEKGLDKEAAIVQAIEEMGDPVLVGTELDRTHRPKIEWSIIVLTGIALLLGFVIRTFVIENTTAPWLLANSIISTVLGIGFMISAYFLDFTIIGKRPKAIYFGLVILTTTLMLVSPVINGQYSYIPFILLLFPTAFAGLIYSMRSKGYLGIVLSGLFLAVPIFIGMVVPSFSSVGLYSFTCLILLTLAIVKGWFNVNRFISMLLVYIPSIITAIVFILTIIMSSPYRWQRLQNALDPSLDSRGAGYIATITRDIIKGAKLFGPGEVVLNPGIVLPELHTNSLLTYLIHEFGWISFIVIITVILGLIVRSFMLCTMQKSILGRLVATSVLITLTTQVALYVAYNLGFQLFSPLTLPLISYGGTATVINMIHIGILLSVLKSGDLVRDNIIIDERKNNLFEIVDGKIIINLNLK